MEFADLIERLFQEYGYWVLLIGLPLDAIALPIPPGNTTLTFTGFLSFKGTLFWLFALVAAYLGAIIGISITYWIGLCVGNPLIHRYGKWLGLKGKTWNHLQGLYKIYGNQLLLISFFVPGIRQFIGYFVGMIRVPYRVFAIYAYLGAGVWVLFFFGLGYLFGDQWQMVFLMVKKYLLMGLILFVASWLLWKTFAYMMSIRKIR